jgi:hypothetical protein
MRILATSSDDKASQLILIGLQPLRQIVVEALSEVDGGAMSSDRLPHQSARAR